MYAVVCIPWKIPWQVPFIPYPQPATDRPASYIGHPMFFQAHSLSSACWFSSVEFFVVFLDGLARLSC
jgi:hypothetical protein